MFSIAVVAHPARAKMADKLSQEVGAEAVCWDDLGLGCADNHLRAMEWLEGSPEPWSVILEDDSRPVSGFREELAAALRNCPSVVCSLYLGTGRPPHWQPSIAQREGAVAVGISPDVPWFTAPELLHGVGYCIQTQALWSLRRVVRRRVKRGEPVDEAVSGWLRQRGLECAYTRPSLVDHADVPTLLEFHPTRHAATDPDMVGRPEARRAWRVGRRETWSRESLPLPKPEERKKR